MTYGITGLKIDMYHKNLLSFDYILFLIIHFISHYTFYDCSMYTSLTIQLSILVTVTNFSILSLEYTFSNKSVSGYWVKGYKWSHDYLLSYISLVNGYKWSPGLHFNRNKGRELKFDVIHILQISMRNE
jgi:hypothetical protein